MICIWTPTIRAALHQTPRELVLARSGCCAAAVGSTTASSASAGPPTATAPPRTTRAAASGSGLPVRAGPASLPLNLYSLTFYRGSPEGLPLWPRRGRGSSFSTAGSLCGPWRSRRLCVGIRPAGRSSTQRRKGRGAAQRRKGRGPAQRKKTESGRRDLKRSGLCGPWRSPRLCVGIRPAGPQRRGAKDAEQRRGRRPNQEEEI